MRKLLEKVLTSDRTFLSSCRIWHFNVRYIPAMSPNSRHFLSLPCSFPIAIIIAKIFRIHNTIILFRIIVVILFRSVRWYFIHNWCIKCEYIFISLIHLFDLLFNLFELVVVQFYLRPYQIVFVSDWWQLGFQLMNLVKLSYIFTRLLRFFINLDLRIDSYLFRLLIGRPSTSTLASGRRIAECLALWTIKCRRQRDHSLTAIDDEVILNIISNAHLGVHWVLRFE